MDSPNVLKVGPSTLDLTHEGVRQHRYQSMSLCGPLDYDPGSETYFGTIPVMYDRRPTDCYNRLDEFSNYNMNHII